MKPFRDLPIQRKLLLLTLLICGAVLFVAIAALFTLQVLNFRSSFQRDSAALASMIANNGAAALAFKDAKGGAEVVGSLQAIPTVVSASLVLPDGALLAQFGKTEDAHTLSQFPPAGESQFTGEYLLHNEPVMLDRKQVGTLYVRSDFRRTFVQLLRSYALVILGVLIVSLSLAAVLSNRLRRIITDPILSLAHIQGRKQAEDEVRAAGEKFETLVNSIEGIVWERDARTMEFTFVSRQSERLLGYTPAQWLANPKFWQDHLHPEDAAVALQSSRDSIAARKPYNHEYRLMAADGDAMWIRESGDVLLENGEPIRVRGIFHDITAQRLAAAEMDKLNKQLVGISRQAGMAEVATGVLHNVGNVLNSVNVSSTLIHDKLRSSEVATLVQLGDLLRQHKADLPAFLTTDAKGKLIPGFIIQLADALGAEQILLQTEHKKLVRNVEHIKEIVVLQQNYARVSGILEPISLANLLDDALQMNTAGLSRHGVQVVRQYAEVPLATADKHKVLQILINLVHNAKYAMDESSRLDKQLTVGVAMNGGNCLKVTVSDNGVGIPPENLDRIFCHGFSTRVGGHGFGLHSGANAAKEMGGLLSVSSEGEGQGATFTLELPLAHRPSPGRSTPGLTQASEPVAPQGPDTSPELWLGEGRKTEPNDEPLALERTES